MHAAAETVKYLEENTDHSIGTFYFAAIANVPAYAPFYPASYHQGLGHQFAIALESANVVAGVMAVQRDQEATRQVLISELGRHARAIQDIASKIDQDTGWTYMGMDLSPAPRREVSIASALAGFTGGHFGTSGTLTAAATITSALRDIMVTKVGYSGLMMPVLEDTRLSQLWGEGAITMDQTPGLLRRLRHGPRHHSSAGRCHYKPAGTHHRGYGQPFGEMEQTAERAPDAFQWRESRRSYGFQ